MGLLKYRNTPDLQDSARGNIHWHRAGLDGMPLRSRGKPLLKNEEIEEYIEPVADGHVRRLRLWEEAELQEYEEIMDRVGNNAYRLVLHEHRFVEDKCDWIVFLVYYFVTGEIAGDKLRDRVY